MRISSGITSHWNNSPPSSPHLCYFWLQTMRVETCSFMIHKSQIFINTHLIGNSVCNKLSWGDDGVQSLSAKVIKYITQCPGSSRESEICKHLQTVYLKLFLPLENICMDLGKSSMIPSEKKSSASFVHIFNVFIC